MKGKILVKGGAGFISNHLVKTFVEQGNEVIIIDNFSRGNNLEKEILDSLTPANSDVRNPDVVKNSSSCCDIIYQFAAVLVLTSLQTIPLR